MLKKIVFPDFYFQFHKESGFKYIYVNEDGSARELRPDEKKYLNYEFHPSDGGRPYIKNRYNSKTPDNKISGYLLRIKLPLKITINKINFDTENSEIKLILSHMDKINNYFLENAKINPLFEPEYRVSKFINENLNNNDFLDSLIIDEMISLIIDLKSEEHYAGAGWDDYLMNFVNLVSKMGYDLTDKIDEIYSK